MHAALGSGTLVLERRAGGGHVARPPSGPGETRLVHGSLHLRESPRHLTLTDLTDVCVTAIHSVTRGTWFP